jgi:hypothetical protein
MMMTDFNFNFNNDGEQGVISEGTIATVQITILPGGIGPGGWLTRAKDGKSENLHCEIIVLDGPYAKRKFQVWWTVSGGVDHEEGIRRTRETLKAILQSVRGIRPDDKKAVIEAKGYEDFDQLRFPARIGVQPASNGYGARNTLREVITPERQQWRKVEQIDRDLLGKAAVNPTAPAQAATPPANSIERPQWAK